MFTGLAMSHNNNDVMVYKKQANKWVQKWELTEHGQRVTGIDWAAKSNRLVTCGAVCII
jgi:actin related protein 2/3 complex subunit 1A/1B